MFIEISNEIGQSCEFEYGQIAMPIHDKNRSSSFKVETIEHKNWFLMRFAWSKPFVHMTNFGDIQLNMILSIFYFW